MAVLTLATAAPVASVAEVVPRGVSVSAAPATGAAPAKRNKYRICDTWDGIWSVAVDDGNGGTSTLRLDVGVFRHERAVGNYSGSTGGILKGDLTDADGDTKACGKRWAGTFRDTSGQYQNKGKFTAQLYQDNGNWHFYGQYKPCKLLCSCYDWRGSFVAEE